MYPHPHPHPHPHAPHAPYSYPRPPRLQPQLPYPHPHADILDDSLASAVRRIGGAPYTYLGGAPYTYMLNQSSVRLPAPAPVQQQPEVQPVPRPPLAHRRTPHPPTHRELFGIRIPLRQSDDGERSSSADTVRPPHPPHPTQVAQLFPMGMCKAGEAPRPSCADIVYRDVFFRPWGRPWVENAPVLVPQPAQAQEQQVLQQTPPPSAPTTPRPTLRGPHPSPAEAAPPWPPRLGNRGRSQLLSTVADSAYPRHTVRSHPDPYPSFTHNPKFDPWADEAADAEDGWRVVGPAPAPVRFVSNAPAQNHKLRSARGRGREQDVLRDIDLNRP